MSDDKFQMTTGQAHELALAFGRNGWSNADIKKLCEKSTLSAVLNVIHGWVALKFSSFSSQSIAIKYGYTVIEDVEPSKFNIRDLKLFTFPEMTTSSKERRQHAKRVHANLGLVDAQNILDHQEEIPEGFKGKHLIFTGTTLAQLGNGSTGIAELFWDGSQWRIDFDGCDWSENNRLVSCNK